MITIDGVQNRTYHGYRSPEGVPHVLRADVLWVKKGGRIAELDERVTWEWGGFGHPGEDDLAWALCADALGPTIAAVVWEAYRREVTGVWPYDGWQTTRQEIITWAEERVTRPL